MIKGDSAWSSLHGLEFPQPASQRQSAPLLGTGCDSEHWSILHQNSTSSLPPSPKSDGTHVPCVRMQTFRGFEAVATPSTVFYTENAAVLPLWAAMIVWPEKPLTKAVMSSYAPLVVAALIYLWLTYEALQVRTLNSTCGLEARGAK